MSNINLNVVVAAINETKYIWKPLCIILNFVSTTNIFFCVTSARVLYTNALRLNGIQGRLCMYENNSQSIVTKFQNVVNANIMLSLR